MESKIRHLEMIQTVISRMASNAFLLKGWTVTVVVGLFAFANIAEMESRYILLAIIPTLIFWVLDGFFVEQEFLYRELYRSVTKLPESKVNFSMETKSFKKRCGWIKAVFSKTLLFFYPPLLIGIIIALFMLPKINF